MKNPANSDVPKLTRLKRKGAGVIAAKGADKNDGATDEDADAIIAKSGPVPVGHLGKGWLVNKSQLLSLTGKPVHQINKLIRDGAPVAKRALGTRADPWGFDTCTFIAFMVQQAAEVAAKRASGGDKAETYEEAKTRDKDAQARLREMDLLERQGKLVDIENIRPRIREAFTTTRSRMLSVPSQIIGLTHAQQRQLEDAINDALAELSDPQTWHVDAPEQTIAIAKVEDDRQPVGD